MKKKNWLIKWFIYLFLILLCTMFFIIFLNKYMGVPLRFSNSISYDSKLLFISKNKIQPKILIIGSSMGLNNVNSNIISQFYATNNILNISSWGSKVHEVFELLQNIDLSKVELVIYPHQYFDFYGESITIYNKKDVSNYLKKDFVFNSYLNTFFSLSSNFKDYIYWKKRFLNKKKYSSLIFNTYGDVNLNFEKGYISQKRWNAVTNVDILESHFLELVKMKKFLDKKKIKLLLIKTPFRKEIFNLEKFKIQSKEYDEKLSELRIKYNINYINTQNLLNLNDQFFVDSSHLNSNGASKVSNIIIKHNYK